MPTFFALQIVRKQNWLYICTVFFMVLDLRLMKVACREVSNFFIPFSVPSGSIMKQLINRFITLYRSYTNPNYSITNRITHAATRRTIAVA